MRLKRILVLTSCYLKSSSTLLIMMLYKFETPIEGAFHFALFHAQRAVELTNEQDTFSLEHLLLLNIGGISNMLHPTIK